MDNQQREEILRALIAMQQQQQQSFPQQQQQPSMPPPPQPSQLLLDAFSFPASTLRSTDPLNFLATDPRQEPVPTSIVPQPITSRRFSLSTRRPLTERERFVVFVKILFKSLEHSDPRLRPRAKAVVTECTRRNRLGDANYMPLQPAVEIRLRRTVGEVHWERAQAYYQQYCVRKGLLSTETLTAV